MQCTLLGGVSCVMRCTVRGLCMQCVQCRVRPALSSPWAAPGGAVEAAPALPAKTPTDALRQQKREQKFTFSHLASFVLS